MKKFGSIVVMLLAMLFVSVQAHADSLTLTGVGPGNTFNGPGGEVYAYPYVFTLNGQANVDMMCDDYADEIYIGENWQANLQTASQAAASNYMGVGGNVLGDYNEAAWLYTQLNGSNDVAINAAIWSIFDPSVTPDLNSQENGLLTAAAGYSGVTTAGVEFETPILGTQTTGDGRPQQFIVATPESPTSLMLGADLLGMLALLWFARKRGWTVSL